jgi:CO/xanthine dehydrogenase FAD-binding subunit
MSASSSSGERSIPVKLSRGRRPTWLSQDALVTEIRLPPLPPDARSTDLRFSLRKAIDFPLVSAAFHLEERDGVCLNVKTVLGAVAPQPIRLPQLEEALKGKRITQDLLRDCSEEAPNEALRRSKSGRIDAFIRKVIARLVYQGLSEVSERK